MAGFFGFFNYSKEGPGVSRDAPRKRGFFRFFDILGRKFSKLIGVNLLYAVCSIPAFLIYTVIILFQVSDSLAAIMEFDAAVFLQFAMMCGIFAVIILGGGPATPGFIYIIRNYAREEHAFVLSDFWEHIKKNLKQSIPVFILDIVLLFIFLFNIRVLVQAPEIFGGFSTFILMATIVMCLLYAMARMYLYTLMVTYKASLMTLIKNSFLLALYRLPQNILMLLLTTAVYFVPLYFLPQFSGLVMVLAVPLIMLSFIALMQMTYTYAVIEKIVIAEDKKEEAPERLFDD